MRTRIPTVWKVELLVVELIIFAAAALCFWIAIRGAQL